MLGCQLYLWECIEVMSYFIYTSTIDFQWNIYKGKGLLCYYTPIFRKWNFISLVIED